MLTISLMMSVSSSRTASGASLASSLRSTASSSALKTATLISLKRPSSGAVAVSGGAAGAARLWPRRPATPSTELQPACPGSTVVASRFPNMRVSSLCASQASRPAAADRSLSSRPGFLTPGAASPRRARPLTRRRQRVQRLDHALGPRRLADHVPGIGRLREYAPVRAARSPSVRCRAWWRSPWRRCRSWGCCRHGSGRRARVRRSCACGSSASSTLLALRRLASVGTAVTTISSEASSTLAHPRAPIMRQVGHHPGGVAAQRPSASISSAAGIDVGRVRAQSPGAVSSAEIVVVLADDARQDLIVEPVGLRQRLGGSSRAIRD